MLSADAINLIVGVLLVVTTLWAATEHLLLAEGVAGRPRKKHRNGFDLTDFDVICVGLDERIPVALPNELSVGRRYMEAEINQILMLNENRRY